MSRLFNTCYMLLRAGFYATSQPVIRCEHHRVGGSGLWPAKVRMRVPAYFIMPALQPVSRSNTAFGNLQ